MLKLTFHMLKSVNLYIQPIIIAHQEAYLVKLVYTSEMLNNNIKLINDG
jgi:hypothetical protein